MNILYCRKSTDSEDRQVLSLESQTNELMELARKSNLKIDKVFTESMSAKEPGRPEFNKMMKLIEQKKNCTLLVWKVDRLARNPIDEGYFKYFLQKGYIAEIKTPFGNHYPADNVLMMSVEFGMANQYIRDLSNNIKRGNKTKLEKGGYTGKTPFGYLNKKDDKTVIPDPLTAPYVEQVFRMFATGGYSLKDLANRFYHEGLRSKRGYKVYASLYYRMLTNPFYIGIMIRNGKHYPGNHQPLVSHELYQACQSILTGNRSKKQKHMFPLRGYIRCAECGCMVTASLRRGHQYYHCTDGKKLHTAGREHFRSEVLNQEIANKLHEFAKYDEERVEIMYQAALEENKQDNTFLETEKQNIFKQQELLSQKRGRTEDAFIDGTLPKERYEARILDLNNQAVDLTAQLKQLELKGLENSTATIGQTKKAFLTAIYAEKDFLRGDDVRKRELAEIILSDMTIKDQKIQQIQFKTPFQRMFLSPKTLDFVLWSG